MAQERGERLISRRAPALSHADRSRRAAAGPPALDHELPDLIGEPTQREQPGVHRPPIGIFVFEELAIAVLLLDAESTRGGASYPSCS